MTELRDARLRKALQDAPDEDARPSRATRDAIFSNAHGAVRRRRPVSWWQRWLGGDGEQRMPWNAAFATLAVATLVTVIWHEREVPDARLDSASPRPAVPARESAGAAVPSASAAAPAIEAPAAVQAPAPAKQAATASPKPPARKAPLVQPEAAPAPAQPAPAIQGEARGAVSEKAAQDSAVARGRTADAASGVMRDEAARSELSKSGPATPMAAAPAPAAPAIAAAAPAPRMSSQFRAVGAGATALRITIGNRSIDAPLAPSSNLAALIGRAIALARGSEALETPIDTRIELLREGMPVGVLELAGAQVRWAPAAGAGPGGTSRPDAALLQSLRDEIARLTR